MINVLVSLLLLVIVVGLLYWITTLLPLPPPAKQIAGVICALIALIWVLGMFGLFPGNHWVLVR